MTKEHQTRARNPFRELLVTELIENPKLYKKMFSEQVLLGETLTIFSPVNAVLVGPQGSGKSMILNLLRYGVLAEYVSGGKIHDALDHLKPFLGISINLQRAYFQAFGRRSASSYGDVDQNADASCAADYLNHFLFAEFLKALRFLLSPQGTSLSRWMKMSRSRSRHIDDLALEMASWRCWYGYYEDAKTMNDLLSRCEDRIDAWRRFLNTSIDIPERVWATKTMIGEPLPFMGNLLQKLAQRGSTIPLYVVIDQYEVLPELNRTHGSTLQRVVNTLIKSRDPVVFYRLGARTYDWGKELRVWGAESKIELQRDYVQIDLSDALVRNENTARKTFEMFACDVAVKRFQDQGYGFDNAKVQALFGPVQAERESWFYFRSRVKADVISGELPKAFQADLSKSLGSNPSPLDIRLSAAWILQRIQRGQSHNAILDELSERPWMRPWWRKERILPALFQLASLSSAKKHFFGWSTIIDLSGANIAAFLLLASEVWDIATKFGENPTDQNMMPETLSKEVQSQGIRNASTKWAERDRSETVGGSRRYLILSRLGPAIHDAVINDHALSNPGHTGFSVRETDIAKDRDVQEFLQNGVSWAILEERSHTSKNKGDMTRKKYYLHPLLSPRFEIPHRRVKEPLYVTFQEVLEWIKGDGPIRFSVARKRVRAVLEPKQAHLFMS